jgi:predicted CoA-binding protein
MKVAAQIACPALRVSAEEKNFMENVVVVGASPKADRYSNQCMRSLQERGYNPIPVALARKEILGRIVYPTLGSVPCRIDTITLYVRPSFQASVLEEAIRIKPKRIIFNPGTENPGEYECLKKAGIEVIEACTLVMLSTNQF